MADVADGFGGQIEIVRRTRGYRRWPDDVKARIVAESFQPGVRVADIARRHGLASHQLSDWRRQARQGLLPECEALAECKDGIALDCRGHAGSEEGLQAPQGSQESAGAQGRPSKPS